MNAVEKLKFFLFPEKAQTQLGIFRIILCGTLFYLACWRQLNIDELGVNALIPREMALNIFPEFYRPTIQWFFWPDQYVSFVHFGLIVLLGLATLGYSNRFFLLLTWTVHQGVLNRNYAINFGADSIGGLFLLYLSFTQACEFYTLKNVKNFKVSDLSSVFFRVIQFQICIIYAYTGLEKLKGHSWWDGTALWTVIANPQFAEYDVRFLSHFPTLIAIATFITLIFEIYFTAFILNSTLRKYGLMAGVLFHLSIGLLLGLMPFSLVMLSTYPLFITEQSIEIFIHRLSRFKTIKA